MPDTTNLQEWVNYAAAVLASVGGTFFAMRRKYSQDSAAIATDNAEIKLISTLMAERDLYMRELKEAHAKELVAVGRIAHVEGLMEACERERKVADEKMFAMRVDLSRLTQVVVKLDPTAAKALGLDGSGIA